VLALALAGTTAGVEAEAIRAITHSELTWERLPSEQASAFWQATAAAPLRHPQSIRFGVFPDGLDELIDLVRERLGLGLLSAGAGKGMLRWSGEASLEPLRELRRVAAEREIPLTLERAPWALRQAFGHFGAYREGVGALVSKLRSTFDPHPTFPVALEGEHD
jgi:hypothetical protein